MNDPIEYTPTTPSEASFWRAFLDLFRIRRNKIDQRQQSAADLNAVWHEADADRHARQPGVSPEALAKAVQMVGRVGAGVRK